ncbi:MAG: ParA family protein [Chromatiales bacterium]|jgi:chromosome partitioning protein|nr:ParA family protein [Chromatiales bacterium]
MHRVMLLNSKGGCGKTTIATNLAGYFASQQLNTVLIDHDGQGSSTRWLRVRAPQAYPIHGIEAYQDSGTVTRSFLMRLPEGTDRVVIDTPANVQGQQLTDLVNRTDSIVVPVLASQIDIDAVSTFIENLSRTPRVRNGDVRVAVVANRSRENTVIFMDLERFLMNTPFSFVARLRDTQAYIRAAETGLSIHELRTGRARKDTDQWASLVAWVEEGAADTPGAMSTAFNSRPASQDAQSIRQSTFAFSLDAHKASTSRS